ncbi:tRNA pseudouridine synthase A [Tenacibaculum todarodis]|uniref:tRNA pseudouridine synthase A n=1 Tax=Tenacibaculum todarodis TaxID=1850252 RepID=A0A1L3JMD6_9FLAO|nr:tRNA pseudouridine synthase A [Tenacibaculum todarodis]APG63851.1 tRNA pseudouridine synthase A [Tenacibaculum todarodis]APG66288.1 tRNA pseudouridine synthase A [Tenacibaculum todarodis]
MKTLQLKVNDKVYDKVLALLGKFNKDEIEIISTNENFIATKKNLQNELSEIEQGKASFVSEEELKCRLDKIV